MVMFFRRCFSAVVLFACVVVALSFCRRGGLALRYWRYGIALLAESWRRFGVNVLAKEELLIFFWRKTLSFIEEKQ